MGRQEKHLVPEGSEPFTRGRTKTGKHGADTENKVQEVHVKRLKPAADKHFVRGTEGADPTVVGPADLGRALMSLKDPGAIVPKLLANRRFEFARSERA